MRGTWASASSVVSKKMCATVKRGRRPRRGRGPRPRAGGARRAGAGRPAARCRRPRRPRSRSGGPSSGATSGRAPACACSACRRGSRRRRGRTRRARSDPGGRWAAWWRTGADGHATGLSVVGPANTLTPAHEGPACERSSKPVARTEWSTRPRRALKSPAGLPRAAQDDADDRRSPTPSSPSSPRVAGREGWTDLSAPPEDHGSADPRRGASPSPASARPSRCPSGRSRPSARPRPPRRSSALTVGVLGACWWVSPTRTAIGLIGAGLFSLVALRRRGRVRSGGLRMGTR